MTEGNQPWICPACGHFIVREDQVACRLCDDKPPMIAYTPDWSWRSQPETQQAPLDDLRRSQAVTGQATSSGSPCFRSP